MTLAATISITAASVEAVIGFLCISFAKASGWRHMRLFGGMALMAAVYSISNVPQTLDVSPPVIVAASQLSLVAAALHLAGWVAYSSKPRSLVDLSRLDRVVIAVLVCVASLALVPGALTLSSVRVHTVGWLYLRYQTAEPTIAGQSALLVMAAVMVLPTARYLRQVWRGVPGAVARFVGFGIFLAAAINEMLVASGLIVGPYLLDFGFLAVVLTISGEMIRGTLEDSTALRESEMRFRGLLQEIPSVAVQGYAPDGTTQYWNQASERLYGYTAREAIGRNLVDLIIPPEMRGDVEQADRLASMGIVAAGVGHEINNPLSYVIYNVESLAVDIPRLAGAVSRCCTALKNRVGAE